MKRSFGQSALPLAAVVVVALFLATACTAGQGVASATPASRTLASTTLAPSVAPATSSATPSPTPAPLVWTQASLDEDWPAPARAEPIGGGAIVQNGAPATYADPAGDIDASVPWIDIRELRAMSPTTMYIGLAVNVTPVVDPTERWIAYGVVWDTDRDGVPDLRFGSDNPEGKDGRRAWITELHSGRTVSNPGGGYFHETFYDKFFEVYWPSEHWQGARIRFGGDTTGPGPGGGGIVGGMHSPFYAWASVIQNSRVIATDYAPDAGWFDPEPWAREG